MDELLKKVYTDSNCLNAGECMDIEDYNYNCTVDILKVWADSYYNKGILLATDDEYDTLSALCKYYESRNPDKVRKDSPTINIGAILTKQSKFKKEKHIDKMYSLDNVFNIEEFRDWYEGIGIYNYMLLVGMLKYDGLSLNLYYHNGILVKAITRGDGYSGENVTVNARHVKGIPHRIDYLEPIEIRGEVVMPFSIFNQLNTDRLNINLEPFASPRNAAVGSLRQLDPKITRDRGLKFKAWDVGQYNNRLHTNLVDTYEWLKTLGFICDYKKLVEEGVEKYYNKILNTRDKLDIPIDGLVFKLN